MHSATLERPGTAAPTQRQLPTPVEIRAEMIRRSTAFAIKELWPTIEQEPLVWNWHLDLFAREIDLVLDRVVKRLPKLYDLIINVPPGTSKSRVWSIILKAVAWARDPTLRIITGSYSNALSLELADKTRDMVKSDRYKRMFPHIRIRADKDQMGKYEIAKYGGGSYACSVGGTITGFHGHIILIDDPLNPKQAVSEVERLAANNWMDHTVPTRKVDKRVTVTIVIMQRLHNDDVTGHMLAKGKGRVRHICLPGEINSAMIGLDNQGEVVPKELAQYYTDGLLDPHRLGRDELKDLYDDLGAWMYSAQIMQRPIPPGERMFSRDNFVIRDTMPNGRIEHVVRYWDKAGTEGGGARTAGVKMARVSTGNMMTYVIMDVVKGQWGIHRRNSIIKQTAKIDGKQTHVWVEREPGSGGKESALFTISDLAGFRVFEEPVTGSKETRAEPLGSQVLAKNVIVLNRPWTEEFLAECDVFPGKFKDQVDAAAGAFTKVHKRRKKAGTWGAV